MVLKFSQDFSQLSRPFPYFYNIFVFILSYHGWENLSTPYGWARTSCVLFAPHWGLRAVEDVVTEQSERHRARRSRGQRPLRDIKSWCAVYAFSFVGADVLDGPFVRTASGIAAKLPIPPPQAVPLPLHKGGGGRACHGALYLCCVGDRGASGRL